MAFSVRRGRPRPAASDGGTMTLLDHLRELRSRLFKSVLAIVAATIVAWFFYDQLFEVLTGPFRTSVARLAAERDLDASLTLTGVASAFTLQIKVGLVTGIIAASPIWLYQLWSFIVPGLHSNERKWSLLFTAIAGPLFILGVAVGYYILPKGIEILISFTPLGVSNLVNTSDYLNFVLRMLLVFGVAFEIPLFVVLLNLAGAVTGRQLGKNRPWIIIGTFVFAAIATPSTDPISMLFLALPMTFLFIISEIIARAVDRRRGTGAEGDYSEWDDEETSQLEVDHDPGDERPSKLDEDDD